jgi:hypothetical protein
MDILDKIFEVLNFDTAQKEQARKDFDVLLRARTVEQLIEELPEDKRSGLDASNAAEALSTFYSLEMIEERTRFNLQIILKEYIEFFFQNGNEQEKEAIAKVLQEAVAE